jgi:dihydrofolate synthase/folylpolyglutamate synthase
MRLPTYQAVNVAMAAAAAGSVLGHRVTPGALETALDTLRLPARFETISEDPPVIVDGSHNPQAAHTLATAIGATFGGRKPIIVLGMLDDKDAAGLVAALADVGASFVVTGVESPRAVGTAELSRVVEEVTGARPAVFESVGEALENVVTREPTGIVVTGSLTTAAAARKHVFGDA